MVQRVSYERESELSGAVGNEGGERARETLASQVAPDLRSVKNKRVDGILGAVPHREQALIAATRDCGDELTASISKGPRLVPIVREHRPAPVALAGDVGWAMGTKGRADLVSKRARQLLRAKAVPLYEVDTTFDRDWRRRGRVGGLATEYCALHLRHSVQGVGFRGVGRNPRESTASWHASR